MRADSQPTIDPWNEIELGGTRDLVVFVDDWKGAAPIRETTPVAYIGRAYRNNSAFGLLAAVLAMANSNRWHVSKRKSGSLFVSDHFAEVLSLLDQSGSTLLTQVWTRRQYAQPEVAAFVASLAPEFRSAWHVDDYQGLALLEFVLRLRWYFANTEPGGANQPLSVLIISDNADWLGRSASGELHWLPVPPSRKDLVARVKIDAAVVRDKKRAEFLPLLRFLGLADSEAWAFGRHLSAPLGAGGTFHEALAKWQETGKDHGVTVEDVQRALSHGGGRTREYQERAIEWPLSGRAVSLTTIGDRHYMARSLARQIVKLRALKEPLTETQRALIYNEAFAELSKSVFSPKTEGSWIE
jgi:hypothetical protein